MDFGKFKFDEAQRAKESRRKATSSSIKEMKYRPKIGVGDFDTKTRQVTKFLSEGHKVKITIMFRGREMSHPKLGKKLLDQVAVNVGPIAKIEAAPKLDGRNMIMVLAPDRRATAQAVAPPRSGTRPAGRPPTADDPPTPDGRSTTTTPNAAPAPTSPAPGAVPAPSVSAAPATTAAPAPAAPGAAPTAAPGAVQAPAQTAAPRQPNGRTPSTATPPSATPTSGAATAAGSAEEM
jgi:translation initiation factor IF-3